MRNTELKLAHIPLASGINQAGGTRGAAPGTLEYVINGRIRTAGRLERRCGTAAIAALSKGGGGSRSYADSSAIPRPTERPSFITSVGGVQVKGTTAGDLYVYDGTFDEFRGCFSSSRPVRRSTPLAGSSYIYTMALFTPAVAVTSTGYQLVASATTNRTDVVWVILDPEGNVIYRGEGLTIETDTWPRAVAQGTKLILVYQSGAAITAISHETSTGVVVASSATSVMTLTGASSIDWDVSSYNSSQWYVTGRTASGTTTIGIVDTVTAGTTATVSTTGAVKLSLWADATNSRVWLGYIDDPAGTIAAGFTTLAADLLSTVYAKTTIVASPDVNGSSMPPLFGPRYARSSSDAFYVFQGVGASNVSVTRYGHVVSGTVTPSTPHSAFHVIPASKPDVQQRFWAIVEPVPDTPGQYLLLRYAEPPGSTSPTLTIDLSTGLDLGHYENLTSYTFHAVAVQSETAGDSTFFAVPQVLQLVTTSGALGVEPVVSVALYEYRRYNQEPVVDFDVLNDGEIVLAGQPTTTIGVGAHAGNLTYYGGVGAVEIGFPLIPAIYSATAAAAGTSDWIFNTVHQWVDARGQRHLSSPSAPTTVSDGSGTVTVSASDCAIGQRNVGTSQRVHTLLFRTVDGGEIPQMSEQSSAPTATGAISWGSGDSDTELAQNEFLVTAGGVLPARLAPACRYVRAAEDRLWCGGLWDRNIIEASRIKVPGEPYQFTQDASHQVVLPADCTGLAYQDGQVVAFTASGIYLVGGDGPNDQGAGAFLPARAYIEGLGCPETEAASILETEQGIFFRSTSSWWIIPRGFGAPVDVGGAIQDEANTHCIASTVTETTDYRLARFLVGTAGEYSSDTVLTFDLMNQQWFRDVYSGAEFGAMGAWPDGLALATYSLERTGAGAVNNVVWSENEDTGTDVGSYITLSFRQNWQYPFGPGGWGKVNRMQLAVEPPPDASGSLVLTMTLETDANSYTPATAGTIDADSTLAAVYRVVVPPRQHCTCYRTTVSVTQSSGAALSGYRLLSLTAELEPDGGIRPPTADEVLT